MFVHSERGATAPAAISREFFKVFHPDFSQNKAFYAPFSERKVSLFLVDTVGVFVATFFAFLITNFAQFQAVDFALTHMALPWLYASAICAGWIILALLNDLYDIPSSHDLNLTGQRLLIIGGLGAALYYFLSLFVSSLPSHTEFMLLLGIYLPFVWLWRITYIKLSDVFLPFHPRVLIVGSNQRGNVIAQILQNASSLHYQILGFIDDHVGHDSVPHDTNSLPILGSTQELVNLVQEHEIHQIVLATEHPIDRPLLRLLMECQANGVSVVWMPDLYEKLCHKVPVEHIDPAWGLYAIQDRPIFQRLQLGTKRMVDLALCFLVWPILLIVLPLLALLIYLDSPGPIFYRQTRCGRGGKPFTIYKFRTMRVDAEADGKARWASKTDHRITNVGKFLRKSRLDELPQIINVLRGDMSFVGPRPERPEFVEFLENEIPFYRTRLMVKPGLTGWAQVHYDYGSSVEDALIKLQYDFYYVRYWSLWLDLCILFRTISVLAKLKGT